MRKIRSLFVIFCFFVFGVGSILFNFLLFPFIKENKELCSDIIHKSWRFFTNLFVVLGLIKLDIKRLIIYTEFNIINYKHTDYLRICNYRDDG